MGFGEGESMRDWKVEEQERDEEKEFVCFSGA